MAPTHCAFLTLAMATGNAWLTVTNSYQWVLMFCTCILSATIRLMLLWAQM